MNRKINIIGLTLFFALTLFSLGFSEEQITITTYYPSPYGSYNDLYVANRLGIGTTNPTALLHVGTNSVAANGEIGVRLEKNISGETGSFPRGVIIRSVLTQATPPWCV